MNCTSPPKGLHAVPSRGLQAASKPLRGAVCSTLRVAVLSPCGPLRGTAYNTPLRELQDPSKELACSLCRELGTVPLSELHTASLGEQNVVPLSELQVATLWMLHESHLRVPCTTPRSGLQITPLRGLHILYMLLLQSPVYKRDNYLMYPYSY